MDFDRSIVLVAEVDQAIVGAGRISREEMSEDFTFSLQVLPECRKKGPLRFPSDFDLRPVENA